MPSPAASRIGKTKVQKTASGSRMNSRKRTRVSWAIELRLNPRWARDTVGIGSLIAQMPAGQHHEDILECSGGLSWLGRRKVRDVDGFHQLPRRAQRYHPTVIDDCDAIAKTLCFFHVVRRQHDRPALVLKLRDQVPELPARLRIEPGGGLVQKEEMRVPDESAGHSQTLLLSAGEISDTCRAFFAELDLVDDFADVAGFAVEALKESERLVDRQLLGELGVLELDSE